MSVSGSSAASPSRAASRLRSSTAPSESSPASISGASADTLGSSSADTSRTTTAACSGDLLFEGIAGAGAAVFIVSSLASDWVSTPIGCMVAAGSPLGAAAARRNAV